MKKEFPLNLMTLPQGIGATIRFKFYYLKTNNHQLTTNNKTPKINSCIITYKKIELRKYQNK